jgi:predicted PurR-regulated permease PerM
MENKSVKFEISFRAVWLVLISILVMWIIINLWQVVALIFGSYIISAALSPLAIKLSKQKIGKLEISYSAAVSVVLLGFITILGLLIWAIIGPTYSEFVSLANKLNTLPAELIERYKLRDIFGTAQVDQFQTQISSELNNFVNNFVKNPEQLLNLGRGVASALLSLITFVAIVLYQVSNPSKVRGFFVSFFNDSKKGEKLVLDVEKKLGSWMQGQLTLMTVMGLVSYIFFVAVGIPFALPLALLVGLLDIVPIVGPAIAYFFVLIITLSLSDPWQVVAATIFFILLQQAEANFLVPRIMENSVGLDPIVVILALLVGSTLIGVTGALLSVPFAAILMIIYQDWLESRKTFNLKTNYSSLTEQLKEI